MVHPVGQTDRAERGFHVCAPLGLLERRQEQGSSTFSNAVSIGIRL